MARDGTDFLPQNSLPLLSHTHPTSSLSFQLLPTSTHEGYSGITITEPSDTSVLSSTHGPDPLPPGSVLPGVKSGSSFHTLLSSSQPRLAPQLVEVMPLQSSSCRFPIAPDCEALVKLQLRHFANACSCTLSCLLEWAVYS